MKKEQSKSAAVFTLTILAIGILSAVFAAPAIAKTTGGSVALGLWHLDKTNASGDSVVTLDSVGQNAGVLGGPTEPSLVTGMFDKALSFSGSNFVYVPISFLIGFPPTPQPIYIPISPALNVQNQIKIDAWINASDFTNATYNNVVVKCTRTDATWQNSSRVVGLAIRGTSSEDGAPVPSGSLSGFVRTESGDFNEIVTAQPVIPLNEWVHVTFTRTTTGMHLYLNGHEQVANVIHGAQNPVGRIMNGTEIYFGHDAKITLDEISITDLAPEVEETMSAIDIGPNLMVATVAVALIFAVAWLLRRAIQMRVIHSRSS